MSLWDFMFLGAIMWSIAIGVKQFKDTKLEKEDPEEFKKQKAVEALAKARKERLAMMGVKGAGKIIQHLMKK